MTRAIPTEAIEAGAKVWRAGEFATVDEMLRAILEAAAPHMLNNDNEGEK